MKVVKYIFVNETGSENAVRTIRDSHVSDFRHHIIVNGAGLSQEALARELVHLRRHNPDAKIVGLQEIVGTNIRPSEQMNALRRALSDLP